MKETFPKLKRIVGALLMLTAAMLFLAYTIPKAPPEEAAVPEARASVAASEQTPFTPHFPMRTMMMANKKRQAFFGALHTHSKFSLDAFIVSTPNDPRDAYRFAQGEAVQLAGGQTQQLSQPLDFAAVTDHAEFFGEYAICTDPTHPQFNDPFCQEARASLTSPTARDAFLRDQFLPPLQDPNPVRDPMCGVGGATCLAAVPGVWQEVQQFANDFNDPGKFTTFVAYEYTSFRERSNLHRNVIFRNDNVPDSPFSYFEAPSVEELWDLLEQNCTGNCEFLAIPHNSNLSNGDMFKPTNTDGSPLTAAQAARRVQNEPLAELMQTKGESECHPALGNDELCDFEKLDGPNVVPCDENGEPKPCVFARNYVRNALKDGLLIEEDIGVNPFKLGFIGGGDTHNGTPGATEENTYKGHHGSSDNTPQLRVLELGLGRLGPNIINNPGGLAGVWAEENTRDAIFDALRRREAFATSGTRIHVRVFGGFDFDVDPDDDCDELIEEGEEEGVPMGSDLPTNDDDDEEAPQFLVCALQDANSAKLQRIQIIKGWVEGGQSQEQVYDVACSDGLTPDPVTGRCPDNGAGVNLSDCSVTGNAGDAQLTAVWTDPDFDESQRAFYYVRVLENQTCRWSSYDAIALGVPPSSQLPATVQERAWTSPIWFTPSQDGDDDLDKAAVETTVQSSIPENYALLQNHPNPFNPSTTIRFDLPEAGDVTLAIYNMRGQLVKTLHSGQLAAGRHSAVWDGTDSQALQVASGVYLYKLKAKDFVATKKLTFMK